VDNEMFKPIEEKMNKTIGVLKTDYSGIRAGRANPSILEKVSIDYYGTMTPINQLGNISVPEARVILIQPWDMKLLKEIEKAIQKSDIGINPMNDGKVIRLVFPALSEERRIELIKVVKKHGEDAKVAIRSIRRDAIEHQKAEKKNSKITEDDLKDFEKDIQILTDRFIELIDKTVDIKDREILEV
jgi:ribosome recycling factor